jgi:hypothetical protein
MGGGVAGDSPKGLSPLPLSSGVKPGARPEAESDPDRLASEVAEVRCSYCVLLDDCGAAGDDVVGDSFVLNRARVRDVVSVDGADFRFIIEGALYEFPCGSTADCGGGDLRVWRVRRANVERSS